VTGPSVIQSTAKAEPSELFGRRVIDEWRQNWRPGVAALAGGAVAYSVWPSVSSLFIEPLQARYGWTRGDLALAWTAGLASSLCAPLIGRLVDRFGVRPTLSIGLILLALCYAAFAFMPGSLGAYYAIFFVFSVVGLASTGITYTRVVSGAFVRTRGTALAISRSGLALSGAILPPLIFLALSLGGLRAGYLAMAGLALFVALPLARLWIRQAPQPAPASPATEQRKLLLLTQPKIFLLCVAAALNYAPVVALLTQMKPLAVSKGMTEAVAVGAVSLVGLAAMAGALLSGLLVDRFWAPAVAFVLNLAPAIGCLVILGSDVSPFAFYLAVLMIGLGQGAEIDIVAFMIARYFGLKRYATIYGLGVLFIGLSAAMASTGIGRLYDIYRDYDVALMIASASFACAALAYLAMGRYPVRTPE
jgi:predicted MFS family arabinose efflux permease